MPAITDICSMNAGFKSGFVSIIGKPNVGKSTMLNALLGQNLVIATPKAQTTRHRIMGIYTDEKMQAVFSDTPGMIDPAHALHQSMMQAVHDSFDDADIILYMIEAHEKGPDDAVLEKLNPLNIPVALVINKAETIEEEALIELVNHAKSVYDFNAVIPLSALHGLNLHLIKKFIEDHLPEHPPYYPEDQLSDRNDRFFVSEFIRKHILIQFSKEIPYSVEVVVDDYQESDKIDRIRATIYVERESQKGILIGKGGSALKKLGEASRTEIEEYLDKKIFLGLTIKVRDNWRSDDRMLTYFGYKS